MAYSTQTRFLKILYPHEMLTQKYDNYKFDITTYDSCCDKRSWSLSKAERSQYYLELIAAHGSEYHEQGKAKLVVKKPAEDKKKAEAVVLKCEISDNKKVIKDLQDQIAELACKLECCNSCQDDVNKLQALYDEQKQELIDLTCRSKEATEFMKSLTEENDILKIKFCETCKKANDEYNELKKKYETLECEYKTECGRPKAEDNSAILEENADMKQNLKEACKKMKGIQQEMAAKDQQIRQLEKKLCCQTKELESIEKGMVELQQKFEELQLENNDLNDQVANLKSNLKDAHTKTCQLTKENENSRKQLACQTNSKASNASMHQSDSNLDDENECMVYKFEELQHELEKVRSMVEDYVELEDNYSDVCAELTSYKTREEELIEKLRMLMSMECEFEQLQNRVIESEKLLKEYQVLEKLECLRSGYKDELTPVDGCSEASDESEPYETECSDDTAY